MLGLPLKCPGLHFVVYLFFWLFFFCFFPRVFAHFACLVCPRSVPGCILVFICFLFVLFLFFFLVFLHILDTWSAPEGFLAAVFCFLFVLFLFFCVVFCLFPRLYFYLFADFQ